MGTSLSTYSQDPQFSQFYASSMYLNPAFTGNTRVSRISGIYRNQWSSIPGSFISYSFAYDHNLAGLNSGVGLMATRDRAGSGGLQFTNLAGLYSYYIRINKKLSIRSGVKFSYTLRGIDKSRLVFGDQIARNGAQETIESFSDGGNSYFDASAGSLVYSEKFWLGFSLDHITQPDQSFLLETTNLPIKSSIHGGYNITLNEDIKGENGSSITFAFNYKQQQKWNQLDIGAYHNKGVLVVGMWYRGIPIFKKYKAGYSNNDAIILLIGFQTKGLKIGYSYDITISKLAGNTGGSHEMSIVYEYPYKKKRRKKISFAPCAKF